MLSRFITNKMLKVHELNHKIDRLREKHKHTHRERERERSYFTIHQGTFISVGNIDFNLRKLSPQDIASGNTDCL